MNFDAFMSRYFWIVLPVFWVLLCRFIARMSGWAALAESYSAQSDFTGKVMRFQSGSFRWSTNYSGMLNIGADTRGLSLSVIAIFRAGHAALFIPWSDVRTELHGVFTPSMRLTFSRHPKCPLIVSRNLAQRIASMSGGGFAVPVQKSS
jgi:hypothetical protein